MSPLRAQANATAQAALHDAHEYLSKHGERSASLDAVYSAAERMVESVEEYERLAGLAHDAAEDAAEIVMGVQLPDVPLAKPLLQDPGDHYVGMPS